MAPQALGGMIAARAVYNSADYNSLPHQPTVSHAQPTGYLRPVYANAADVLAKRGELIDPVHALRPHILTAQAQLFLGAFPGTPMYAVKVNPDPQVLDTLASAGICTFDVASLAEIELVRTRVPQAELFFMHPVKPRHAIRTAYFDHGVRDFSLDSMDELQKILQETNNAPDLGLHIRLGLPKGEAFHGLSAKFGATPADTATLLQAAHPHVKRLGLCFHVGSQMMNPQAYEDALAIAGDVITDAGVALDSIDVGGGYPVSYPGMTPPPLQEFFDAIKRGLAKLNLPPHCRVLGEPGRALVADAGRLLVRVDARKGDYLYINDGGYGSLFDAAFTNLTFGCTLYRNGKVIEENNHGFMLYGPTCDSIDVMPGPFMLPADAREGDVIEFAMTGSYTYAMQSHFNGFFAEEVVNFMR